MRQPIKLSFARAQGRALPFARARDHALPSILTLALALAACGGDDKGSETEADTGTGGQDASSEDMDSGHQHGGNDGGTTDGASSDAQSGSDAGSSDAGGSDAGTSDAGTSDAGKLFSSVRGGSVSVLDGGTSMAKGAALLVRTSAGRSLVSLQVSGLIPGKMYPAHVHNL
ncbi:MAG TPA: hypothetical protein VFZ61_13770, partial [Polyangiales bacterium]